MPELEDIIKNNDIGVIKSISRNMGPNRDYLENIRKLATKIILFLFLMNVLHVFVKTMGDCINIMVLIQTWQFSVKH